MSLTKFSQTYSADFGLISSSVIIVNKLAFFSEVVYVLVMSVSILYFSKRVWVSLVIDVENHEVVYTDTINLTLLVVFYVD